MRIPYTLNDTGITFFLKGQKTFSRDSVNFEEIKEAVFSGDVAKIDILTNVRKFVSVLTQGNVVITTDEEVLYKNQEVPLYLATRIISHFKNKVPVEPLMAFAEKLMDNPNVDVREDLYKWVENGNMPIFDDGDFMAYKTIRADYTPIHHGPYGRVQRPGMVVEMPRNECNGDRDMTCSTGLHFCSYDYLPNFGASNLNQRVIVLKINPADVVAIPTDYNLTKGRTCRFEVIDEVPFDAIEETFGNSLVLTNLGTYQSPEPVVENDKYRKAYDALEAASGNKTQAAEDLGIARSTLNRWLSYDPQDAALELLVEEAEDLELYDYDDESWESWDDEDNEDDLDDEAESDNLTKRDIAYRALMNAGCIKAHAAANLGISTRTLGRWLNS